MSETLSINKIEIKPGTAHTINLPAAPLYTQTEMNMPVRVIRGKKDGPRLFVCAAIHGDEINGVEIVRRLLMSRQLSRLRGTLIAVPVVNIYGYTARTRYLPDRRDLNRFFPGSPKGSMASRLAHLLMEEIVTKCTHGIDLHTGSFQRSNLPHVRTCIDSEDSMRLARAFRAPVILHSNLRDGSLREATNELNIPILLYEGGEALRFNEHVIRTGLRGVLSVMRTLNMLPNIPSPSKPTIPVTARTNRWVRAPESGTLLVHRNLGSQVSSGDELGMITDPLGEDVVDVNAPVSGIVIGRTLLPLVYEGEAIFNIACLDDDGNVSDHLEQSYSNLDSGMDVEEYDPLS
ncbi:succinylglutamate desuccinylase/aspartoacylase family protein [Thermodesulfobacteriota bacterium]